MRYDDASNAGSMAADSAPTARPDVDSLPSNDFGPASGNVITGAGTASGATGADTAGDGPARVVEVNGPGGPTAAAGDSFQAAGQYGVLTMDAQGNFNYVRNAGTPDGVQDVFGYTIADRDGSTASTTLTMNVGEAITLQAQNVVNLPPGVEMSDIRVSGRDLIINMPDGTQMVIPGGAVFVPQLVIGDVELPQSTLARLLIDNEPQPGAGTQFSSGGPPPPPVPPLDPGVPLGDLVPPTDMSFPPFIVPEVGQFEDEEPGIIIDPDDNEPAVNAVSSVDESGLPARPGEPEGTLEPQNIETRGGQILIDSGDGIDSLVITVNGVSTPITSASVGTVIAGLHGNLTITSVNLDTGVVGYSYTVTDNTIDGSNDFEDFTVVVTDNDGDTATGTLHIDILDDEPIAADDTDAVPDGANSTDGNVLTAVGTTNSGEDTPGADGFSGETNDSIDGLTGVHPGTSGAFTAVPQNGTGVTVSGTFGDLTIHVDGSYTYVLHEGTQGGGTDVFTYQITDGDGDNDTATLTITVPIQNEPPTAAGDSIAVSEEGLPPGNEDDTGNPDTTNLAAVNGNIGASDPNGDPLSITLGVPNPNPNFTSQGGIVLWSVSPDGHTLIGYVDGGEGPDRLVITVEISDNAPGNYTVTLHDQIDHPDDTTEDAVDFSIPVAVDDGTAPPINTTIEVSIEDDSPVLVGEGNVAGAVGEDALPDGNPDAGDTKTTTASGSLASLVNFGSDEPGSFTFDPDAVSKMEALNLTSNNVALKYAIDGDILTAYTGADPTQGVVFTLQVQSDGDYQFDLLDQIDHLPNVPANDDNQNLTIDFGDIVDAADFDGDAVDLDGRFNVSIEDDIPTLVSERDITGAVGEDALPDGNPDAGDTKTTTASGSLSPIVSFGADQPGSFSFDPDAVSKMEALNLTSNNVALKYAIVGDTLIAYTGANSGLGQVFTLQVQSDGDYQFDLLDQIDHLPNVPANDDNQNLTIDFGDIVDATDADGDAVDLDGRFNVSIEDDIPTIPNEGSASGAVGEDALPGANPDAGDTKTTVASGTLSTIVDFGADQPGQFTFDPDAVSKMEALSLTSNNVALKYAIVGDTLIAYTGANSSLGQVFTLQLQSDGDYRFELLDQIDHLPNVPANDDNQNLVIDFGDIIDATDADGDKIDLDGAFNIAIEDDIPIARNDTDEIVGGGAEATGNVITGADTTSLGAGADSAGADAPITVVKIEGAGGTNSTFANGVLTIAGDHGILEIAANGQYTYTRTDDLGGVEDEFTYTIRDADGDEVEATLTIHVEDNTPIAGEVFAKVDDDGLTGGNPGGTGDIDANDGEVGAGSSDEKIWTGTLQGSGGDAPTHFLFEESLESVTTDTLGTEDLRYEVSADGLTLQAFVDSGSRTGTLLFDIVITNATTGAYTLTLRDNVLHDPGNNETSDNLTIPYQIQDADDDLAVTPGSLHIEFNDDTPVLDEGSVSGAVGEDALADGNPDAGDPKTTVASGSLSGLVDFGADTPGSFTFDPSAVSKMEALNLTSNSVALKYAIVGDTLIAYTGATSADGRVFTLQVQSDGDYQFNLLDQIDHLPNVPANDDNQNLTIDFGDILDATDADGDKVDLDGKFNVSIEDDIPAFVTEGSVTGAVGEDTLPGGNPDAGDTKTTVASGSLTTIVDIGADQPGEFTFSADAVAIMTGLGLKSNNVALKYAVEGDLLIAYTGATSADGRVFTLEVNDNGAYEFTLLDQIDHLPNVPANDDNQNLVIDFGDVIDAVDEDGDKLDLDGRFTISIEDDIPELNAGTVTGAVGEDTLPGGNPDAGDTKTTVASGSIASLVDIGADQPGTIGFAANTVAIMTALGLESNNVDLKYEVVGDTLVAFTGATNADGRVFTLELQSDGDYEFTLLDAIDHEGLLVSGSGDDEILSIDFGDVIDATDADGDKVDLDGKFTITIEDDIPEDIEPEAVNVEQGGTVTGDLDIAGPGGDLNGVADNYGADGPGTVRFPSSLEGTDSGLESQGQNIIYHLVDGQTLQGRVGATVIFTITLDPTNSEYTVDLDGIIDSLTQINFNDGTYDFVGGNDTWAGFVPLDQIDGKAGDAPINDDSKDLLLTPIGSGTAVNGNATSAGVTGPIAGQNIGEGEGMRLDFIEDLTGIGTPGDYNVVGEQTHDFDAHYLINGASVRFGQGTSTLTTTSFRAIKVTPEVIDDNGDDGTPDLVDGTGALVSVNRVVINYDGEFQVVDFDAGDLSQTVTVGNPGGLADRSYTVTFIQEGGEWYATVQGIHDNLVSMAIFADEQYNALELLHEGPDSSDADYAITGFGAATQSTDPVGFEVPVEIVDADGDTADGTLDVTVYPVGGVPAPLTLLSANDNQEQKLASNNTMIMSAALAAAGLATEPLAASPREHGDRHDSNEDRGGKSNENKHSVDASSDEDQSSVSQLVGTEAKEADNAADDSSPSQDDAAAADKGVSNEDAPAPAVSELSQGTDAPTQSEAQTSAPAMADSVGMPSAEQLIAASSKNGVDGKLESVDGKDAGNDEQVAKVLADALQGGEDGKDLDALISAISGKGQDGDKALEALASHGGNDVSNGDMAGFGGLSASHGMDMMTQMTMHQDAAPAQA